MSKNDKNFNLPLWENSNKKLLNIEELKVFNNDNSFKVIENEALVFAALEAAGEIHSVQDSYRMVLEKFFAFNEDNAPKEQIMSDIYKARRDFFFQLTDVEKNVFERSARGEITTPKAIRNIIH